MEMQLDEVFDSEGILPVINLNPKLKVPQIWSIGGDESQLVARMVSYTSEGDAIKQVKMGDKYAHIILMSLSPKGTPAELKGGLGVSPFESINSIFSVVYEQVKRLKMDAVMFRFPTKKMKGQGPIVQRVIQRLVLQKTGGRFKVIPAMYQFTGKHTYILVVRKNADIEDIKGMPGINPDIYTKVESDIGDVYVSKKDGVQVTKDEALAGSIAAVEEKRSDRSVIARTRVSRRQVAAAQTMETLPIHDLDWLETEEKAAEFSGPATAEEIKEAQQILDVIDSPASKLKAATRAGTGIADSFNIKGWIDYGNARILEARITENISKKLKNVSLTSLEGLKIYAQEYLNNIEEFKYPVIKKLQDDYSGPTHLKDEFVMKSWNSIRTRMLKDEVQNYAKYITQDIGFITSMREPTQYDIKMKRGIKEYVGSGYRDINNFLLGRYDPTSPDMLNKGEIIAAIKGLDDAFKVGDKIPEGVTLWRAQTIKSPIYEALIRNRVFYFRNYVSTSLMPIIFGGWNGNVAVGLASDQTRAVLNIDGGAEEFIPPEPREDGLVPVERVTVGWAINGANKINVIYPGDLSNISSEMEIILPRGTMVSIDKITDASSHAGVDYRNQRLIEATVMTKDQIDESTVVYDGDVLMETGELVPMDKESSESPAMPFASFSASSRVSENKIGLQALAALIDLAEIPEKFIL